MVGGHLGLVGLSTSQARERLAEDGPNELPRPNRRTPLRIAMEVLREPMFAMLLAAGVVYLLLGDRTEALVLLGFAGLSIIITIVQEARTERTLEALRDLSAPRALVVRDGETLRIPGREVVNGDILVLEAGDRIAADALVVEARELEADESLLTGEAVPVRKRPGLAGDAEWAEPGGDDTPHLFSGAIVTHGGGIARVTATGGHSRIGQIGRFLETLETEAPHLHKETTRMVSLCAACERRGAIAGRREGRAGSDSASLPAGRQSFFGPRAGGSGHGGSRDARSGRGFCQYRGAKCRDRA